MTTALTQMASHLKVNADELQAIVLKTVMPSGKQPTIEQFNVFIAVANEYKLNPLTKEIYAFPTKGGGIQPIVSIDGWLKIINSHPSFDGMAFEDGFDNEGNLKSITCRMFRTDRKHPVEVIEYLAECQGDTEDKYKNKTPWGKFPARMLRHKATIQCARYAFGFSGIIDPDEADRFEEAGVVEKEVVVEEKVISGYPQEDFDKNYPKWMKLIETKKKTAQQIIDMVSTKGQLSEDQIQTIKGEV